MKRPFTIDDSRPSKPSAARLSLYLRCLESWQNEGRKTASSRELADILQLGDAQVRKDIAYVGSPGHRGIGYRIPELIEAIRKALGINREWKAVIVGAGNLARALLRYRGFSERGFRIVSLFDSDPKKAGQKIDGIDIHPMNSLLPKIKTLEAELGIITVPSEVAQEVADKLISAGVRGILNFAPTVLQLPESIPAIYVDLTVQLEQLAFLVENDG